MGRILRSGEYEGQPSAVDHTFSSFSGAWGTIKACIFNRYANPTAAQKIQQLESQKGPAKGCSLPVISTGTA